MLSIEPITIDTITESPNYEALAAEYAAECKIQALPLGAPLLDEYRSLEKEHRLVALGAFEGEDLVGFLILVENYLRHHSQKILSIDSIFLRRASRKGLAGLRLFDRAQREAERCGASGLFLTAPIGSSLEKILDRKGFNKTTAIYFIPTKGEKHG